MSGPLWVLAIGAALVGFVGVPVALGGSNHWHHWLSPVLLDIEGRAPRFGHGVEFGLAVVSVAWAALAIFLAMRLYRRETDTPRRFAASGVGAVLYRG